MKFDNFSNPQLVTIAVAFCNGDTEYVDREDVAIKVNEIAPGRFNWRKYPERIDLDAVKVSLRDAKKLKNGGLLVGDNSIGWMLSPVGLKWIETLDFTDITSGKHRKGSISASREAESERLRDTKAYQLFIAGEIDRITLQDFYHFARINEYFQTKARQRRYSIINNAVTDDEKLFKLWHFLKHKFGEEQV